MMGYMVLVAGFFQRDNRSSLFGFCAAALQVYSDPTDAMLAVTLE